MISLTDFNQSRLCVFVVSKEKSKPLSKVLLYAEATITEAHQTIPRNQILIGAPLFPSYITDSGPLNHLLTTDKKAASAVRDSLARVVDFELIASSNAVDDELDKDGQKDFDRLVKQIIEDLREAGLLGEDASLERLQTKVNRIVGSNARLAGVINGSVSSENVPAKNIFSLGVLGTDHIGYASWDLTQIPTTDFLPETLHLTDDTLPSPPSPSRSRTARAVATQKKYNVGFELYYNMSRTNQVDILSVARVGRDAIVAIIELPEKLARTSSLNLSSMQHPNLVDWRISPGSFVASSPRLLGENGCESMLPSTFATHRFPVREIQRILDRTWQPVASGVTVALAIEYEVSLKPIGHSLGEIAYSLPLAPGESVRLAVVDWHRNDAAGRDEKTKLDEGLLHDQTRDRTISELVNASMNEIQKGKSIMGGFSGGAGGAYSSGSYGAAGGLMASFGGASSSSQGSRQISVDTMQAVADAVHQASNSVRELTSTVVVQSSQAESELLETRSFSNFNRGHTMTVLYYETLRHYHVKVEMTKFYEAVLIPRKSFPWYPKPNPTTTDPASPTTDTRSEQTEVAPAENIDVDIPWDLTDTGFVLAKRYILEPMLLNPSVESGFDALNLIEIQRRRIDELDYQASSDDSKIVFRTFRIRMEVGQPTDDIINIYVGFNDSARQRLLLTKQGGLSNMNANFPAGAAPFDVKTKQDYWVELITDPLSEKVTWGDIKQLEIVLFVSDMDSFEAIRIQVFATPPGAAEREIFKDSSFIINMKAVKNPAIVPIDPPVLNSSPRENPAKAVPVDQYHLARNLMEHIRFEKEYYNRVLDLSLQPEAYAECFEDLAITADQGSAKWFTEAQPTVIGVVGKSIAFPRLNQDVNKSKAASYYKKPLPIPQRMVSLPARGLFAEAKLGHCNVAEIVDDTRFWKWDEHPLPIEAPDIAPAQPVIPTYQVPEGTTPTAFPVPIINIQQPQAAPDPTGTAAALKAITTPDVFRDMSGIKEVQGMLKDLTDGAVKMAQTAASALAAQQKNTSGQSQAQMNHEKDMAKISSDERTAAANRPTPETAQRAIHMADNAVAQGKMTSEDRNKIVKNQLETLPGSTKPPPTKPTPKPVIADPLRKRKMQITIAGYNGYPMGGQYEWHLSQDGTVVVESFLENAVQTSTIITEFTPITDRPLFLLAFLGDIAEGQNKGLQLKHPGLEIEITPENWEKYMFYSVQLTPTTQPFKSKSKSVKELIKKFGASFKAGGSIEEEEGIDAKVVNAKVKRGVNAGSEINWTPGDEDITTEEEVEMELTYYDGGLKVKGVK